MADKDEFKFDDDDTFPETDLSGAFSEGEQAAPEEPEYPMTVKKSGGSKTRLLLVLLLLVVAGGAGYFFLMEEPEAPPPPPPKKAVAVAPKPAPAPPAPAAAPAPAAGPAGGQSQLAVAPPPKPAPAAPAVPAAPAAPAAVSVAPPPKPAPTAPVPAPPPVAAPAPAKPAPTAPAPAKPAPAPVAAPAPAKPAATAPPPSAAAAPKPAERQPIVPVVAGGPWLVEAGTFVNQAAARSVEQKIRALGYEPQISTMKKSVRMTRLRLGSFPESEVKEALAYARGIAPDAFALRAGETYTVYAGTFTSPQNIQQMIERLAGEGIPVEQEPLESVRNITLVRFGGFADRVAADQAAALARKAGIAAEVVKPR